MPRLMTLAAGSFIRQPLCRSTSAGWLGTKPHAGALPWCQALYLPLTLAHSITRITHTSLDAFGGSSNYSVDGVAVGVNQ